MNFTARQVACGVFLASMALASSLCRAQQQHPQQQQQQPATPQPKAQLTTYRADHYTIYTDVDKDAAREAVLRMNKMFDTYVERTRGYGGVIHDRLPFFLFTKKDDYYAAGGMRGSAGVFTGSRLMAIAVVSHDGRVGPFTWHIVQHEGFHQFVAAVIGGHIPTWVNEGLAEYFGEGIFTGDDFVTGGISSYRALRVQAEIRFDKFIPVRSMLNMHLAQWNSDLSTIHYDQAWSMIQYVAHGDNAKYQTAFIDFMNEVSRGGDWERCFEKHLGNVEEFEKAWKQYWLNLPANPTATLYTQADVEMLTSFLARAYAEHQTFASFDQFINTAPQDLKIADVNWLPSAMFNEAVVAAKRRMEARGYTFELQGGTHMPRLLCTAPDGTKFIGHFQVRGKIASDVVVDVVHAKGPAR